jgi:hypothetical protein
MDKVLKVKDFVIGIISFIIALLTLGYNIGNWQGRTIQDINDLKGRVREVESENKRIREDLDDKIEPMRKDIVDIKVLLQNKQDRK